MTPEQTALSVCTTIFCIAGGYLIDIKDELSALSILIGIMVGLSVLAVNLKKLFTKTRP